LELQFLGGSSEVGRSAVLLKGTSNILLDYGIKLDHKTQYPLQPDKVDICILSHAHLDHSGNLPTLYKSSFPITYGTEPTRELSQLLIDDSMGIGKKNHQPVKFTKHQLKVFLYKFAAYEFGAEMEFGNYLISFYDAGHVSGSMITKIESKKTGRKLVYTGDFKLDPQMLQGSADIVKSDILITESTYATREHPDREELTKKFIQDVRQVIEAGGTALVPAFAVGRSQELLAILHKNKLTDCTYIDGMARKATQIAMRHPEFIRNKDILEEAIQKVTWIGGEDSRGSAVSGQKIILTTAGMLNGGPVLNYITRLGPNSKIFLTGYQVEGTNGRKLIEGKPLSIEGRKQVIKTPFAFYDFSAHADKSDLYEYAKKSNPETIFCMHGDEAAVDSLAENLKIEGFKTHAPRMGDSFKIDF
jgi:putative mRNA 3-end processing factor